MKQFVVFEGLDGSGKSSVILGVKEILLGEGEKIIIVADPPMIEPWISWKEYFEQGEKIDKVAEAFMLLASRIDNTSRIIKKALVRGAIVLADRYYPSWLAYQQVRLSDAIGLSEAVMLLDQLQSIVEGHSLVLKPDKIIFLQGDPKVFAQRLKKRDGYKSSKYDDLDFQYRVAGAYEQVLANASCEVFFVDTIDFSLDEVITQVMNYIH
ncbi:MAG: dTMP kinase [bacterium]